MRPTIRKILLFILLIVSLVLYFNAPIGFEMSYVVSCSVLYLIASICLITNNCKTTLVKFEFFFLIVFFFTNYSYPLIHYAENPYFSLFFLEFNESYICKAIGLSTVGACAFCMGIIEYTIPKNSNRSMSDTDVVLKKPGFIIYILFILFIPQLVSLFKLGEYSTEFENSYVNVILIYLVYYFLIYLFNSNKESTLISFAKSCLREPVIYFILLYVVLFLGIGSRTIPLRIVLLCLFLFNFYVKKISNIQIVLIIIVGALCLAVVGITREGAVMDENSFSTIWDIGSDLTINNRSLYVLMEYVDKHGYTYGQTMLMGLLSVIPFMQSLFLILTGMDSDMISSGGLVTSLQYSKGDPDRIGLGTNLIGDIYVSFGVIGVVLLMFLLGKFLRNINRSCQRGNILGIIIYSMMFIDAVYLSRSSFLACVRAIAWVYAIYYLYNKNKKKLNTNRT